MVPSQRAVQIELRKYIRVDTARGLSLFLTDILMYLVFVYAVIVLPDLWMKVLASIMAGVKISNLSVIGHDAAHNSLTRSKTLNKYIAVTSFLPCLFNYQLWLYDHNRLHHSKTNEKFPDSYTPLSKREYDRLSKFGKWKVRKYREPSLIYFGIYYVMERWRKVKLYPTDRIPSALHKSAWKYTAIMICYAVVFIGALACAQFYSGTGTITAIMLGFILPFYIFQSLYAAAVYVQHTHPGVPWFVEKPDRRTIARQEFISVHYQCPAWINALVHHIFDHSAHHACPAIPCYQLGPAQARLNELLGERAITEKLSLKTLFDTMRICKLYDYENHCWLDFNGNRTTDTLLKSGSNDRSLAA